MHNAERRQRQRRRRLRRRRRRRRVGSAEVWVRPRLSGRIWRYKRWKTVVWARSAYLVEIVPGESDTRKLIARRGFFANKIANATAVKAKEGGEEAFLGEMYSVYRGRDETGPSRYLSFSFFFFLLFDRDTCNGERKGGGGEERTRLF